MGGRQGRRADAAEQRQADAARLTIVVGHPLLSDDEDITDAVEMGIYFYPKGQEPKYRQICSAWRQSGDGALDIPPNSIRRTESSSCCKQAARIESFQPHMHLRGKAMSLEAILPNGRR